MNIDEYLIFVANRLKTSNREEVLRLLRLVIETCGDTIRQIQSAKPEDN